MIYLFNLNESPAAVLVEACHETTLNARNCRDGFQKLRNGELTSKTECCERPRVNEDTELEALYRTFVNAERTSI